MRLAIPSGVLSRQATVWGEVGFELRCLISCHGYSSVGGYFTIE